ncbi:MAG TPA: hypothetical protein VG942_02400 [Hyphomonadaceae bacterium]|nr:hypothetical protein [Hyphomonadaceae bacterium]
MIRGISLGLALLVLPAPALAQSYQPPRDPAGHPDLTGQWSNKWLTPLEKGALPTLTVTPEQEKAFVDSARKFARTIANVANDPEAGDPDATQLTHVRGEIRTRMIIAPENGMLPYTPEAQKKVAAYQAQFTQLMMGKADNPEARLVWERCLGGMGQAPMLYSWSINGNRRLVQTKDALVIHSEAGGDTRIIRIGGTPLPGNMRSFMGDSIGRWEGDTLMVETTGFRPDDQFRVFVTARPIMVTPDSKVIERFTRVGPDEIDYQFTVEDPKVYSQPWLAEYSMVTAKEAMYEFACHEGNYALPNILSGQREIERRKANAAPGARPAR